MWLVVGLGNPGPQYEGNRHNVGFMVADEVARRAGTGAPRRKFGADVADGTLAGQRLLLCKPMEFMNVSGQAAARVAQFFKVPAAQVLVVHDELDVPFGRLKLSAGGGPGGHNGIKSLISCLGTDAFPRVRVGIGRPPAGWDPADYVLADFSRAERADLDALVSEAAEAVETVVGAGLTAAMNKFNAKKKKEAV